MSTQNNNHSIFFSNPVEAKSEDFVSLYFEQNSWGKFFELVNEYGSLSIEKLNADITLIKVGQVELKVTHHFGRWMIRMMGVISMDKLGAGELLAKIADLLFHDRKSRLMLECADLAYEEKMWKTCFNAQISLKPIDSAQQKRFQAYAAENSLQNKVSFSFDQKSIDPPDLNQDFSAPRVK